MRLIDVDALKEDFILSNKELVDTPWEMFDILDHLDDAPTVDAVPVVHGRWEDRPTGRYGQQQSWCSACGVPSGIGGIVSNRHRAYCPNCGAKMDGGGDNGKVD